MNDVKGFKIFTGGPLATNACLLETGNGNILFDAPADSAEFFRNTRIDWLLLTHGHFDHLMDAAAIVRDHGCKVGFHADTAVMAGDGGFFKKHGFDIDYAPCAADLLIGEGPLEGVCGERIDVLLVPGHCPGSLCFHFPGRGVLVGGDVLFREAVGRWDLPGGDGPLLFKGIREKVFTLPGETVVLPGHGPETTVAHERRHNPFVQP